MTYNHVNIEQLLSEKMEFSGIRHHRPSFHRQNLYFLLFLSLNLGYLSIDIFATCIGYLKISIDSNVQVDGEHGHVPDRGRDHGGPPRARSRGHQAPGAAAARPRLDPLLRRLAP